MTDALFRTDPYLSTCDATVVATNERGGIILDRTVFYPTGGGQPGDTGWLERGDGGRIDIATTVYGADKQDVVHVAPSPDNLPAAGEAVVCHLDWPGRHRHMRMHTALHLLSAILPYPVTGGSIGEAESRLDFDIPEAGLDKEDLTRRLNDLVDKDHQITFEWITDADLATNPDLVKTMSVKPPTGAGKVRLIRIGDAVDLQPCGGTHVSTTGEIGPVIVSKIEKKGRQNRRVRIRLED